MGQIQGILRSHHRARRHVVPSRMVSILTLHKNVLLVNDLTLLLQQMHSETGSRPRLPRPNQSSIG